jgi:membrane complex biogenesis protein, BtpA family
MLDRTDFASRFGSRAVFGMVHLRPLPGSPAYNGSFSEVIDAALADAVAIRDGGAQGMVFENFGDRPFRKNTSDPETIAAMTWVIAAVLREVNLPFGVNVLRNDALSALGIAAATRAAFIRVNILTGAMLTDQGIIEGPAADLMRRRVVLGPQIAVFADHMVKHAVPLAQVEPLQSARDLRLRGMADAIIVTGSETGKAAPPRRITELQTALGDTPLIAGSGVTSASASSFSDADAIIVGTSLKRGASVAAPVSRGRVEEIVAAFR